ncbi:MAG: ExbD/TolR family protein [Planctomycetota bacterium]
MRAITLSIVLCFFVGCGGRSDDVRLPTVGTVGDLPPPGETLAITIRADGSTWADGRRVDAENLLSLLAERTRDHPRVERYCMLPSKLHVLLRCDQRARFGALMPVIEACSDPSVRATRLFYAVRAVAGDETGAFAWYLAQDTCICGGHSGDPVRPWVTARVEIRAGLAPPVEAESLYPALCALPQDMRVGCVSISAGPATHVGYLLRTADICLRAGAAAIVLEGWPLGRGREPTPVAPAGMRLNDVPVTPADRDAVLPQAEARTRGQFAGFARDISLPFSDPIVDEAREGDVEFPVEESLGD